MSETAFKAVGADLKSAFLPWDRNPFAAGVPGFADVGFTYEVGGDYEARGIQAILGYFYMLSGSRPVGEFDVSDPPPGVVLVPPPDPPIDIRDPVNRFRGIMAFPSLDSFWLRPFGNDPLAGARYLQLEYDEADVLSFATVSTGDALLEALNLAHVHVVAEVTP